MRSKFIHTPTVQVIICVLFCLVHRTTLFRIRTRFRVRQFILLPFLQIVNVLSGFANPKDMGIYVSANNCGVQIRVFRNVRFATRVRRQARFTFLISRLRKQGTNDLNRRYIVYARDQDSICSAHAVLYHRVISQGRARDTRAKIRP